MAFEYRLPDVGEGLVEAEIVSWKVKPGDEVAVNDVIVEIETSKSLVELPCPESGRIGQLLVPEGQVVEVGTPIVAIETGASAPTDGSDGSSGSSEVASSAGAGSGSAVAESSGGQGDEDVKTLVGYGPSASATKRRARRRTPSGNGVPDSGAASGAAETPSAPSPASPTSAPGPNSVVGAESAVPTGTAPEATQRSPAPEPVSEDGRVPEPKHPGSARPQGPVPAKPPVRKLAKDLGIDLTQVRATGPNGTVTRADLEAYRSGTATTQPAVSSAPTVPTGGQSDRAGGESETRIPIRGVRRTTAKAVSQSAFTAPHVTEWLTVDVTATVELLERLRARREFAELKVTPLLLAAKAAILALRRTPELNATWDEDAAEIVLKHYVHLGVAVDAPRGLLVPNVRNADRLALPELAGELARLTLTAREGATQPSEMAGTTFSITNVGVFGVDGGTPILNPGESGILAIGQIARRPWVVQEDGEEAIRPRWVTTLALSFDHRIVDGAQGSRFLADVGGMLHDPGLGVMF